MKQKLIIIFLLIHFTTFAQVKKKSIAKPKVATTTSVNYEIISNPPYESDNGLKLIEITYAKDMTYLKFKYTNEKETQWFRIDEGETKYIQDRTTTKKYLLKDFCTYPVNKQIQGGGTWYFVWGFEKMSKDIKNFDVIVGNNFWKINNVNLSSVTTIKSNDYITDFASVNIYEKSPKPKNIAIQNSTLKLGKESSKYILSTPTFDNRNSQPIKILELYQDTKQTFIKFSYPSTRKSGPRINTDLANLFYIFDPMTSKKYYAKDFNSIPVGMSINVDGLITFVIGFERIPNNLKTFEILEGDNALTLTNNWYIRNVDFTNSSETKNENYIYDYITLNRSYYPNLQEFDKMVEVPSIDIENELISNQWRPLGQSEFKDFFENKVGLYSNKLEFKGDFKNGYAIIRDIVDQGKNMYISGYFIDGNINGYGKIISKSTPMTGDIIKTVEGTFKNNKLHGKGRASKLERLESINHDGYFYHGYFITNDGFGGIDEKGQLFIKLNDGKCKFYPEILIEEKNSFGMSYATDNFYCISKSLGNAIFGDEETESISWSGGCENGFAEGNGIINMKGKTKGFWNNKKDYTNDVLFGTLHHGKYQNCKVYNFNDFATMLVSGEEAKKWSTFMGGIYVGEDLTEVRKVQERYSASLQKYREEQEDLKDHYELIESEKGIANVYVLQSNSVAYISVEDGGLTSSNVKSDNYSTIVYDRNGKIKKSYNSPYDDNGIGSPSLNLSELPGKIIVNYYSSSGNKRRVELKIKKAGNYTLKIN